MILLKHRDGLGSFSRQDINEHKYFISEISIDYESVKLLMLWDETLDYNQISWKKCFESIKVPNTLLIIISFDILV